MSNELRTPLVSVIIPVYNGGQYILQAIDSVLNQTYKFVEIIAIDDGSTDDSVAKISSFGSRVVLIQQGNQGVAYARNAGIRIACGELIAFLDQDDWWLPDKIRRQVDAFLRDADLGLVHTATLCFDNVQSVVIERPTGSRERLIGRCYEQLLLENKICNSSAMVRRKVLDAVGPLDTTIKGNTVQDYDLWLRVARKFPLGYVKEPVTVWRLHPRQAYWNRQAMLTEELRLLEDVCSKEPRLGWLAMKVRLATVMSDLAEAHLKAGNKRLARRCFVRSIRTHWSWRNILYYGVSFFPSPGIELLRKGWEQVKQGRASS